MIILASGSPRRIELLASLGLEFLVRPAAVDETIAVSYTHLTLPTTERV